ncbi:phage tail protein [Aeromonas caviae]
MSQVITNAFEQYWQSSQAAEQPVVLDEFILADIPNLDITSPIDPDAGLPPESQIVHRQNVDQRGRINNNAVAYTIVMDTTVGDFSFNAMYLRNKQNGVIGMIVYKGRETKLKTDQTTGQSGNSLVKSMLMGYDQAAEATLTNVDAGTWQIDYAARLSGMDEDIRQLQADLYGHHTFVGDGFKVVEQDGAYQVTQGVAIVGGLRVELKAPEVIHPGAKPIGVWVDVHRAGSLLSEHQNHFTIITSVADLTDHVDSNGYQHYVAKLATVLADDTIEDGRGSAGGGSGGAGAIPDTFALWKRSMAEAGYDLIGQFGTALTIETAEQVVLGKDGRNVYAWTGDLPKYVDEEDFVSADAGWESVLSETLRDSIFSKNGAIRSFDSVGEMKRFNVEVGLVYSTNGYYVAGDGGGAKYISEELCDAVCVDGYGDHISLNNVVLRLLSDPTDLNHGVVVDDIYKPGVARHNRNAIQAGMRNSRFSVFSCVAVGKYYLLGSVNVARDNVSLIVKKGCSIVGRYSDPNIDTPDQSGGMINYAHFFDPDAGDFIPWRDGDKRVNKRVYNVNVVLDGDVSTEYSELHDKKNNNNCIAFLKAVDCRVVGVGGVSGSDHRGINFDMIDTNAPNGSDNRGGAINCHVDVSYVNGCVNNPVMIAADVKERSTCTINIGTVGHMKAGGFGDPIVAHLYNQADFLVQIGRFIGDNVVKPALVASRGAASVKVRVGVCNGAKSVLYSVNTLDQDVEVEEIYNTPVVVIRGGVEGGKCRSVKISGIKSTDSNLKIAYSSQNNASGFLRLDIVDNNFVYCDSSFKYYGGKVSAGLPLISNIARNISPSGIDAVDLNLIDSLATGNLVVAGATSVTVSYKVPDWNYKKISVIVQNNGVYGGCEIDIRTRVITNQEVSYMAGESKVVTRLVNGDIVLSVSGGVVFHIVTMHN